MNTANNTPMTITQAKRQANIFTRAQQMLDAGYRVQQYGKTVGYAVFKPENMYTQNTLADYFVSLTPGDEFCKCPDFEAHKDTCKHIQFVKLEKARQATEDAHMDFLCEQYDNAECSRGCDYSDHHF